MVAEGPRRFDLPAATTDASAERPLGDTIDRSWTALTIPEQVALAQLSVFAGGFTLDAAVAVLDPSAHPDAPAVADVLRAFGEKALLVVRQAADDGQSAAEARHDLDGSIRDHAARRLLESGQAEAAQDRHARYFLRVAAEWGERVDGCDGPVARKRISADMENLLAVHRQASAIRPPTSQAATRALGSALAIDPILRVEGPYDLRLSLLDAAIDAAALVEVNASLRLRALEARGDTNKVLGRTAASQADLEAALAIAEATGDRHGLGRVLGALGLLAWVQGRLAEARAHFDHAQRIQRAIGDRLGEGRSWGWLGMTEIYEYRQKEARALFERAVALNREVGDKRYEGINLTNGAFVLHHQGHLVESVALHLRALEVVRGIGDRKTESLATGNLATLYLELGRLDDARETFARALRMHHEIGDRWGEAVLLADAGLLEQREGALAAARASFDQALVIAREFGDKPMTGLILGRVGALEVAAGRLAAARAIFDQAELLVLGSVYLASVELYRAQLDAALARQAASDGDRPAAQAHRSAAERRLRDVLGEQPSPGDPPRPSSLIYRSMEVRFAWRGLVEALAALPA